MSLIDKLLRRKKADPNARRRLLLASGRITDGVIIDSEVNPAGEEIVVYTYTLNGVDFESSDILTFEQRQDRVRYAPGAKSVFVTTKGTKGILLWSSRKFIEIQLTAVS